MLYPTGTMGSSGRPHLSQRILYQSLELARQTDSENISRHNLDEIHHGGSHLHHVVKAKTNAKLVSKCPNDLRISLESPRNMCCLADWDDFVRLGLLKEEHGIQSHRAVDPAGGGHLLSW